MSEPSEPGVLPPGDHDVFEEIRPSWSRSDRLVPRRVVRPLQEFLQTSDGERLAAARRRDRRAAVGELSVAGRLRGAVLARELAIGVGSLVDLDKDLHFWVNDGLMALFFLVVGMEIKREVVSGELRRLRVATLPILAALGGMVVPALVYVAIAGGGAGEPGMGHPDGHRHRVRPRRARARLGLRLAEPSPAAAHPRHRRRHRSDPRDRDLLHGRRRGPAAARVVRDRRTHRDRRTRSTSGSLLVYIVLGAALWYATYESGIHPDDRRRGARAARARRAVPATRRGERGGPQDRRPHERRARGRRRGGALVAPARVAVPGGRLPAGAHRARAAARGRAS